MKLASLSRPLRQAAQLGLIGAAFLCAGSVSAASFSFQVLNDTLSGGDPTFPVTDDLTFINLSLKETFADNFTALVPLKDFTTTTQISLDTGTFELDSDPFTLPNPTHGALTAAILNGSITVSGLGFTPQRTLTLQTAPNAPMTTQRVYSNFSTNLFSPPPPGVSVGQLSLLDSSNNIVRTTPLNVALVPESSGAVNMVGGLLGLGGLALVRRRRRAAVNTK